MKHIQSTLEGSWIELLPVSLTEEQETLIRSTHAADKEAQAQLILSINSQREAELSSEEIEIAQNQYLLNKPELKEGDVYQLIAVDITLNEMMVSGIINCRINGEHKQIRF